MSETPVFYSGIPESRPKPQGQTEAIAGSLAVISALREKPQTQSNIEIMRFGQERKINVSDKALVADGNYNLVGFIASKNGDLYSDMHAVVQTYGNGLEATTIMRLPESASKADRGGVVARPAKVFETGHGNATNVVESNFGTGSSTLFTLTATTEKGVSIRDRSDSTVVLTPDDIMALQKDGELYRTIAETAASPMNWSPRFENPNRLIV